MKYFCIFVAELAGSQEGKTIIQERRKTMNVTMVEDVKTHCWRVENPSVALPPGYQLWEDEHLVYLLCGEDVVATFNAVQVEPSAILMAAEKHCQARG